MGAVLGLPSKECYCKRQCTVTTKVETFMLPHTSLHNLKNHYRNQRKCSLMFHSYKLRHPVAQVSVSAILVMQGKVLAK
jgi:hypothetical protein